MDLERIIWSWEPVLGLLSDNDPLLAVLLGSSCRPIAADRQTDGGLLLVLGCWISEHKRALRVDPLETRLTVALSHLLGDQITPSIVDWPVGTLPSDDPRLAEVRSAIRRAEQGLPVTPPVVQPASPIDAERLSGELLGELGKCETVLQRMLFARLVARRLEPQCQIRLGSFRIDVALPAGRVAADVLGWENRGRRGGPRGRDEEIMSHGWTTLTFTGRDVYENADGCAAQMQDLANRRRSGSRYR